MVYFVLLLSIVGIALCYFYSEAFFFLCTDYYTFSLQHIFEIYPSRMLYYTDDERVTGRATKSFVKGAETTASSLRSVEYLTFII